MMLASVSSICCSWTGRGTWIAGCRRNLRLSALPPAWLDLQFQTIMSLNVGNTDNAGGGCALLGGRLAGPVSAAIRNNSVAIFDGHLRH